MGADQHARNSVKGPPADGRKLYQTNGWTFWKYKDVATARVQELNILRMHYLDIKQK